MKKLALILTASALATLTSHAQFTPGYLAVVRLGNGTETLGNTGNSVFIDQYALVGAAQTPSFTLAVPNAGVDAFVMSGTSTSEGALARTLDGSYLTFGGYNQALPNAVNLPNTTGSAVNRMIAQVDRYAAYSVIARTTQFGGTASPATSGQIRSVAGDGAGNYWGGGVSAGTSGVYWFGSPSTFVTAASPGARNVNIFNGNLYYSIASSTYGYGILGFVGGGMPTTSGNSPVTFLNVAGVGTGTASPYDFAISPAGTIAYVADDRTTANGGGIQRWDFNGTSWNWSYTFNTVSAGSGGGTFTSRQLAVDFSGSSPLIFATTTTTSANRLVSILDSGAGSTADVLAQAPTGAVFRGVEFTPIPEPAAWSLLTAGLVLICNLRRRRR